MTQPSSTSLACRASSRARRRPRWRCTSAIDGRAGRVSSSPAWPSSCRPWSSSASWPGRTSTYGDRPEVGAILAGVAPVVVAIVAHAGMPSPGPPCARRSRSRLGGAAIVGALAGASEIVLLLGLGMSRSSSRRSPDGARPLRPWPGASGGVVAAVAAAVAVTPFAIFLEFFKIGAVLFGSGYVMVALLQAELVESPRLDHRGATHRCHRGRRGDARAAVLDRDVHRLPGRRPDRRGRGHRRHLHAGVHRGRDQHPAAPATARVGPRPRIPRRRQRGRRRPACRRGLAPRRRDVRRSGRSGRHRPRVLRPRPADPGRRVRMAHRGRRGHRAHPARRDYDGRSCELRRGRRCLTTTTTTRIPTTATARSRGRHRPRAPSSPTPPTCDWVSLSPGRPSPTPAPRRHGS